MMLDFYFFVIHWIAFAFIGLCVGVGLDVLGNEKRYRNSYEARRRMADRKGSL